MRINIFPSATVKKPENSFDRDWPDIALLLRKLLKAKRPSKLQLPAFNFCCLREPYNTNDNVLQHSALVIDVDGCLLEDVLDRVEREEIDCLVYGSPSDDVRNEYRRIRVCSPLTEPLAPEDTHHARYVFAELLGLSPGQGVETADSVSHIFFAGRLEGTKPREVYEFEGAALDTRELLETSLRHTWKRAVSSTSEPLPRVTTTPDERTAALVAVLGEQWEAPGKAHSRRQTLRGLGGYLAKRGWDDGRIAAVALALPTARPATERLALVLEAAQQARERPDVTAGWSSLVDWQPELVERVAATAKDPREPEGFPGVWSDWWARAYSDDGWIARGEARRVPPTEVEIEAPEASASREPLSLSVTRQGQPRSTCANVLRVLEHVFGDTIFENSFRDRIAIEGACPSLGYFPDGYWTDAHTTSLVVLCESMDLQVSKTVVNDTLGLHARTRARNPIAEMLTTYADAWDGVPRVDTALQEYWGARRSKAARAVSRIFLLSLVARGLQPGVKVDTVPVLIQRQQGHLKSTALERLVGLEYFSDSPLALGSKEAFETIRGKLLWEIGENASLSRRDRNAIKQFFSSRQDTYRRSYGVYAEDVARTCVFVITTNDEEVLSDPTGARRFLPLHVQGMSQDALDAWTDEREQLLGEAAARVLGGEQHWETPEEKLALDPGRKAATETDAWEAPVLSWLRDIKGDVTVEELLDPDTGAVPIAVCQRQPRHLHRIGDILRNAGYAEARKRRSGVQVRVWVRPVDG